MNSYVKRLREQVAPDRLAKRIDAVLAALAPLHQSLAILNPDGPTRREKRTKKWLEAAMSRAYRSMDAGLRDAELILSDLADILADIQLHERERRQRPIDDIAGAWEGREDLARAFEEMRDD